MPDDVTSAWIAAGASLLVSAISAGLAIWTSSQGAATQREQVKTAEGLEQLRSSLAGHLEELKSSLAEKKDAAQARRDYEYDARKRLYTDLYPLAYQMQQAAARARHRIMNLALATRDGHLSATKDNWLTGADLYYFNACLYDLAAPLAIHELMTRKLTQLDLTLDRDLAWQQGIANMAREAMRADFELSNRGYSRRSASFFPPIDFGADHPGYDPAETRPIPGAPKWSEEEERRLWRQGLYSGEISQVAEALLAGTPETVHVMTFAEFLVRLNRADPRLDTAAETEAGSMVRALRPLVDMLRDFHPARRPITWRILLAQGACYQALAAVGGESVTSDADAADRVAEAAHYQTAEDRAEFLWVGDEPGQSVPPGLSGKVDFDAEQTGAIAAADLFVGRKLRDFARRLTPRPAVRDDG